jgi:SAM-dependent methyltransferase
MAQDTLGERHTPLGAGPARRLRVGIAAGETRNEAQLREHYEIERSLADRLRGASRDERRTLYPKLYDELFRRVPHHPMLRGADAGAREKGMAVDMAFLRPFLRRETVFMEIGAGDCALSCKVAALVKQVYAVEVSEEIARGGPRPANFRLVISDGCSIPVPDGGVDVAFSDQLMEHLHPEDAREQLRNIHRSLAPGGAYVCFTPNALYGPCDISRYFEETASGFHLREYTARELRALFAGVGFSRVRFYAGARRWFVPVAAWVPRTLESALGALPYAARKRVADTRPMRAALGLRVVAIK